MHTRSLRVAARDQKFKSALNRDTHNHCSSASASRRPGSNRRFQRRSWLPPRSRIAAQIPMLKSEGLRVSGTSGPNVKISPPAAN